jgi:hypothetical protein
MNAKITYHDYEEIVRQNPAMFDPASRRAPEPRSGQPNLLLALFSLMAAAGAALAVLSVQGF